MNICVCLICHRPNNMWVEFLSNFKKYDIYIVIDDNSKDYKQQYSNFSNINIIQINNEECKKKGFVNMNFVIKKYITAWEKSIYYFSNINIKYDKVWFFEDDVFFYDENVLSRIDSKFNDSDLLSREFNNTYISGPKNFWHWENIKIKFEPPYYRCLVCCVRMSSNLLFKISDYANKHNTLFFLEALFPTICKINNMQHDTSDEFINIVYRKNYMIKDFNEYNIYHPIKKINLHKYYRIVINKNIIFKKLTK